jgi:hypothetical protein
LAITNHTDVPITVSVGRNIVTIDPDHAGTIDYPSPHDDRGILQVKFHNCILQYLTPPNLDNYPWRDQTKGGPLPVQLENDLKLYATPPDSRTSLSQAAAAGLQRAPFPLIATRHECA